MKGTKISFFAGLLFLMTPLGCQGNNQNPQATEPAEAQQQKEAVEQSGTPMTDKVMQTQRGPDGMKVNLIKADVTGKLLTVEIQYVFPNPMRAPDSSDIDYHIKDVSYIDSATSKIYGVVKDKSGSWMAAPLDDKEKVDLFLSESGESEAVWFMFPAPSPETNFIFLNVPGVGPFKVKVRR